MNRLMAVLVVGAYAVPQMYSHWCMAFAFPGWPVFCF